MTPVTEPLVVAALDTMNDGDAHGLCALFAPDGTVAHEGKRYRGAPQITAWFSRIPSVLIRPIRAMRHGTAHVVEAEVSGTSPHGPQLHRFTFELAEHQIRSMSVNIVR